MMTSKIMHDTLLDIDEISDQDFEKMLGLSKESFIDHAEEMAALESQCIAFLGEPAPDFSAHLLNADGSISSGLFSLSSMRGNPAALIFGCYTCPIFRRQTDGMNELISKYEDTVSFISVYVTEAHPTNGWNTPSNVAANIMYKQPETLGDRAKIAHDWKRDCGLACPSVLDWSDNRINQNYCGSPERLFVLDADGVVTFNSGQGPHKDTHLENWAADFGKRRGSLASDCGRSAERGR